MSLFLTGKTKVMVCTDIVSRGVDTQIVSYPHSFKDFYTGQIHCLFKCQPPTFTLINFWDPVISIQNIIYWFGMV